MPEVSTSKPRVIVLGAGPAGLGAACRLAQRGRFRVTVLERSNEVGGNAGSFEMQGLRLDYGSHRLHPSCSPQILADIKGMLGDDLLDRPRHGRILLRGNWVHFPLRPLDLALHLPPDFLLGVMSDKLLPSSRNGHDGESFASLLEKGLGSTICRDFYFPYARKIWGLLPGELDAEQARRRVSASSVTKLVRKVLGAVPGLKPAGSGRFFYPRGGFGQISDAYRIEAEKRGVEVRVGIPVREIRSANGRVVEVIGGDAEDRTVFPSDVVLSTIPLTLLARMMRPAVPEGVQASAASLRYRSMILIYVALGTDRFTEYDAHYFPGSDVPITRLSEPKNYGLAKVPGRTVLCAELPCSTEDSYWTASDEELVALVRKALASAGLTVNTPILEIRTRRLPQAYPIYELGYRAHFECLDNWFSKVDGLLTLGRQGLFAHDNTHHTLAMAYSAVDCVNEQGGIDRETWVRKRREFESHVVED